MQRACIVCLQPAETVLVKKVKDGRFAHCNGHRRSNLSVHNRQQHHAPRTEIYIAVVELLVARRREMADYFLQTRREPKNALAPIVVAFFKITIAGNDKDVSA